MKFQNVMKRLAFGAALLVAIPNIYADEAGAKDIPVPAAMTIVTNHKGTFGGVRLYGPGHHDLLPRRSYAVCSSTIFRT